jgi:hypothetical protein
MAERGGGEAVKTVKMDPMIDVVEPVRSPS